MNKKKMLKQKIKIMKNNKKHKKKNNKKYNKIIFSNLKIKISKINKMINKKI